MAEPRLDPLPRFSTIGLAEKINLSKAMRKPLSGYLGGVTGAGYWIERLSAEWCETFRCKYAVPCNSATSGLLAACMAADIKPGDLVWTTPYSMSAMAACAKVLGAVVKFMDIETLRYAINMNNFGMQIPKAIIVANIFGHPAHLHAMRTWCDLRKVFLIEDNAQAPFSMEYGDYAGTIGHMGVFSLNVHKHIQCGEGGVVCTNNPEYSLRLRMAINHGELTGSTPQWIGLNLRMTEPIAAIACAQLEKALNVVSSRRSLAYELSDMVARLPGIDPPVEDKDCRHVYYLWAARMAKGRDKFVAYLNERGFPIRGGYSPLLNKVFKTDDRCPTAEMVDSEIVIFEICAYDPNLRHLKQMREIIKRAHENCE